jgi:hypothetical protein
VKEGCGRERVRCSSLVDWPVYSRLEHSMRASNVGRMRGRRHAPHGIVGNGGMAVRPIQQNVDGHAREANLGSRWPMLRGLSASREAFRPSGYFIPTESERAVLAAMGAPFQALLAAISSLPRARLA